MSAVLIRFCLVLLHVCGSSEGLKVTAEPGQNVTVRPGDDVNLRCGDPNIIKNKYLVFEWIRTDLKEENMFFYRSNRHVNTSQHESFKNRVSLKDTEMKDGDLSVVLKNVTVNDTGIYQCRVRKVYDSKTEPKLISTIDLSVVPPGKEGRQRGGGDGENKDDGTKKPEGLSGGVIAVITVVVLLLVLLAVLYCFRKKRNNPRRRSSEPNNQPEDSPPRVRNIDGKASEDSEKKKLHQRRSSRSSSQSS